MFKKKTDSCGITTAVGMAVRGELQARLRVTTGIFLGALEVTFYLWV